MARDHITLKDVAKELKVNKRTVIRWIDTGKVGVPKKKNRQGHYRFSKQDLDKLRRYAEAINET